MTIQTLSKANFTDFKDYCMRNKYEHDESLLYDEDMEELDQLIANDSPTLMVNYPTYLLYENDKLKGVCSLVQDLYMLKGHQARVRIFHCEESTYEDYKALLDHALQASLYPIDKQVEKIVMFLPNTKESSISIIEKLGFAVNRYTYVMVRAGQNPPEITLPTDFSIIDFDLSINDHIDAYMHIRNTAFAQLKGSETPHSKAQIIDYLQPQKLLKGGCKLLCHQDKPIGLIRLLYENDLGKEYAFVAPLAVLPEFQGRGLGALLLRIGIQVGIDNGYEDCMLTVNAENDKALKLYKQEGFEVTFTMVCYHLKL